MNQININNKTYFQYAADSQTKKKTQDRLQQIKDIGLEEVGIAEFGMPGIMSGLYIERVWNCSDKQWSEYIEWIIELIKTKQKQQ